MSDIHIHEWIKGLPLAELQAEFRLLHQEKTRLEDRCEELMEDVTSSGEATAKIKKLKEDIGKLTADVKALTNDRDTKVAEISALAREKDRLAAKLQDTENRAVTLAADATSSNAAISILKKESAAKLELVHSFMRQYEAATSATGANHSTGAKSATDAGTTATADQKMLQNSQVSSSPKKETGRKAGLAPTASGSGRKRKDAPAGISDGHGHKKIKCPIEGCDAWSRYNSFKEFGHWEKHMDRSMSREENRAAFLTKLADSIKQKK